VWAWNACLALVCGDSVVWKPSEKTPLTAYAVAALFARAAERFGDAPPGLVEIVHGGRETGEVLADDARVALVSATGSTRMGRELGPRVTSRFGRVLLELGGNNAMIVAPSADLELAERAITFSAVGHRRTALHHAAPPVRARQIYDGSSRAEADLGGVPSEIRSEACWGR
jgi:aldehyde dehydrogenase (NAD+)